MESTAQTDSYYSPPARATVARSKARPQSELIISPFPGLIHVVQIDDSTPEVPHWAYAVPYVVAALCMIGLLVFGPPLS